MLVRNAGIQRRSAMPTKQKKPMRARPKPVFSPSPPARHRQWESGRLGATGSREPGRCTDGPWRGASAPVQGWNRTRCRRPSPGSGGRHRCGLAPVGVRSPAEPHEAPVLGEAEDVVPEAGLLAPDGDRLGFAHVLAGIVCRLPEGVLPDLLGGGSLGRSRHDALSEDLCEGRVRRRDIAKDFLLHLEAPLRGARGETKDPTRSICPRAWKFHRSDVSGTRYLTWGFPAPRAANGYRKKA